MKILYKILFIFIGIGLVQSCSEDDDTGYLPEWDTTALAYTQELSAEGVNVKVNFKSEGMGRIYYAIYQGEVTETVTAEALREEYGQASGSGLSDQIGGGVVNVSGLTDVIKSFTGNGDESYTVYSTSANEYDYIGDVKMDQVNVVCAVSTADKYITHAYSDELGIDIKDGPVSESNFTRVAGTCDQFLVDSLWGQDLVAFLTDNEDYSGQYVYPAILTINADNTVVVTAASEEDAYVTGGSGTYNPETGEFDLLLNQGLFSDPFTINVKLKLP